MTSTPEPGADPARLRLERDLASGDFQAGADAGLWRLASLTWPYLTMAIAADDGGELGMRIIADDYPRLAPGGQPWDLHADAPLPTCRWPASGSAGLVFRADWSVQNNNAPYMACDRTGLATHPHWATQHPDRAWNPGRTIMFYLREIHRELQTAVLPHAGTRSAT
jgi:hypothetical protein